MNINLTKRLEAFVREKVESGLYNNASEVVREALRQMHEKDTIKIWTMDELEVEIQKGVDSGCAGEWTRQDVEDIKRRGREKLAALSKQNAA